MSKDFVHLHTHTCWGSILDSIITPKDMVSTVKNELGCNACAITDHGNMASVVMFYKECLKQGVKPILGLEAYITDNMLVKDTTSKYNHLILLAKNNEGYKNLKILSSIGYTDGFYRKPRVDFDTLKQHKEGLIVLSACVQGEVAAKIINKQPADAIVKMYKDTFGEDYYLELQSHVDDTQKFVNMEIIELATKYNVELVVTTDAHFVHKDDFDAHNLYININQDRDTEMYKDCYLQSYDEMVDNLKSYIDVSVIKKALHNTVIIADKCNVEIELGQFYLPKINVPDGCKDDVDYFYQLCKKGLISRKIVDKPNFKEYKEKLRYEFDVISKKGFQGYFIMLKEFLDECKQDGIFFGPARGSAGGCLIAYLLGITDVDPIKFDLDFSRFLNEDRINYPDIDIDIPSSMGSRVLEKLKDKYGHGNVAQIVTFGCLQDKSIIEAIGKIMEIDSTTRDEFKRIIGEGSVKDVMKNTKFYNQNKYFCDICMKLVGLPRSTSIHASAVVICPQDKDMQDFLPVMLSKEGLLVTQYEMHDTEDVGLVKFDFLKVSVLDAIQEVITNVDEV